MFFIFVYLLRKNRGIQKANYYTEFFLRPLPLPFLSRWREKKFFFSLLLHPFRLEKAHFCSEKINAARVYSWELKERGNRKNWAEKKVGEGIGKLYITLKEIKWHEKELTFSWENRGFQKREGKSGVKKYEKAKLRLS